MSADAIVVGAGIVGASIAWTLARHGAQVILMDAGAMGGEASWAGAGMLAPGGEIVEPSPWYDLALDSLRQYPQFVEDLQRESGRPIDFQRCGAIELARTPAELSELERRAVRQIELGIPSRPCGQGRFYPEDCAVDPRDVMNALRTACLARKVTLLENCPVRQITPGPRDVRVRDHTAKLAVLAAGAWSSSIQIDSKVGMPPLPKSYPVRGHLLGYRLQPGVLSSILRHGHTYLLQRGSGYLIAGSSMENVGFDRRIDPAVVQDIQRRAEDLLPDLARADEPDAWIGFRPGAEALAVGRAGEVNLWLAYGHYRNGILLAPATAQRIVSSIMSTPGTGWSSNPGTP